MLRRMPLLLGIALLGAICAGRFALAKHQLAFRFVIETSDDHIAAHIVFVNAHVSSLVLHYTEHLAWLNAVGGTRAADRHSNAWTSDTAVGYWLSGAPEDLPELLETLKGVFDPIDLPRNFAGQ